MSRFDNLIATAEGVGLHERKQFLQYLLNVAQQAKLQSDDKDALLAFAYKQVDIFLAAIPEATCYKEKDFIFEL